MMKHNDDCKVKKQRIIIPIQLFSSQTSLSFTHLNSVFLIIPLYCLFIYGLINVFRFIYFCFWCLQCYYIFGDLCSAMSNLKLQGDTDSVGPLPNVPNYMPYSGTYNPLEYMPMPFYSENTVYGYNKEESVLSGSGKLNIFHLHESHNLSLWNNDNYWNPLNVMMEVKKTSLQNLHIYYQTVSEKI